MRRLAFATPFVVVVPACGRPVETRVRPEPPEVAVIADASPDAPPVPRELVDELPALSEYRSMDDFCRRAASCNPPSPATPPPPPKTTTIAIDALVREDGGSRVRAPRVDPRIDRRWRARFVDRSGSGLEDGECAIVALDYQAIECSTSLAPERLVADRRTHRLRLEPPAPPPPAPAVPTGNPPPPARIIEVSVEGAFVLVRVSRGSKDGVTIEWRATLLQDGRVVPGGDCTIVRVTDRTTVCKAKLTVDQVKTMRLRLEPKP